MKKDKWSMKNERRRMNKVQLSVKNERWRMNKDQRSVKIEQGSMVNEEWTDTNTVSKVKALQKDMHEQNSVLDWTSTPNARGTQGTSIDTSQQLRIDPSTDEQTEPRTRATELSAKQQTLLNRLNSDRGHLDREEGWNGISPHGPSHQGPRILLIAHQGVCGTS